MNTDNIDYTADLLDSRDLEARLEELNEEHDSLQESILDLKEQMLEGCIFNNISKTDEEEMEARELLERAKDRLAEWEDEFQEEWEGLASICSEGAGYGDWEYGETLISADYFTEYVKDMLQDIGDLPRDIPHYIVIDWDATAENIKQDYMEIDVFGQTYYMRA